MPTPAPRRRSPLPRPPLPELAEIIGRPGLAARRFEGSAGGSFRFACPDGGLDTLIADPTPDWLAAVLQRRLGVLSREFEPLRQRLDTGLDDGAADEERTRLADAADECLRIADHAEPLESTALRLAASYRRLCGDWRGAVRTLRRHLAGEPDDVPARIALAECLGRLGRNDEARAAAQRAASSRPQHVGALLVWAACLNDEGRIDEAERVLADACRLARRDARAESILDRFLAPSPVASGLPSDESRSSVLQSD